MTLECIKHKGEVVYCDHLEGKITCIEECNVSDHLDAAERLLPYKEVLEKIVSLTEEERADLLFAVNDPGINAEAMECLGFTPERIEIVKQFVSAFCEPQASETYLHLMGICNHRKKCKEATIPVKENSSL